MKNKTMQLTSEQQKLFDYNIDLAEIKVNTWLFNKNSCYDRGDLLTFAYTGLVLAAQTYNPNKGCSFRTYASTIIKHELLHGVEQYNKKLKNEVSVDFIGEIKPMENNINNLDIIELKIVIEKYLSYCDPLDAKIFKEVIINDRSRTDVAGELNISIQTVSTKIKEMQKEFINFLNLQ